MKMRKAKKTFWQFPFQYRITDYGRGIFKVEKWLLGLKLVAWNIECILWS